MSKFSYENITDEKNQMVSVEMSRFEELIAKSQLTEVDAERLDNELKENWWQENKERFLAKIQ